MFQAPALNLPDVLHSHARSRAQRVALVSGDRQITWAELNRLVNQVANGLLARGLRKGDKVALLSLSGIEAVAILFGAMRAGGVVVPLSPLLTPSLLGAVIRDAGARFLFTHAGLDALIAPLFGAQAFIPVENRFSVGFANQSWTAWPEFLAAGSDEMMALQTLEGDEANIIYSSGTTGVPKGIVHSHRARMVFALGLALEFRIDSQAVPVLTIPLFSNTAWALLLPSVVAGCRTVLMDRFTPAEFLSLVEREGGSHTIMVPTQIQSVLECPDLVRRNSSSLRIVVTVGSAMPMPVKQRFLERYGNRLLEVYGLTEGVGTCLKPEEMASKPASVGTPLAGSEIRILGDDGQEVVAGQTGEIVGYSGALMNGYHNQPAATAEVIWRDERGRTFLRTGDMGRFDEDGYLYILDRKKDMILSGAMNVFASDIEEELVRHPDVAEACVIAVPHEKWGESPLALVVRNPGASSTEDALREWLNARVAKHQRVLRVEFRNEFPRNVVGKVLKKVLREPYWKDSSPA